MTLLPRDPRDWPEDARAFLLERRAIREYDGRQPRDRADAAAEEDARRWWRSRAISGL